MSFQWLKSFLLGSAAPAPQTFAGLPDIPAWEQANVYGGNLATGMAALYKTAAHAPQAPKVRAVLPSGIISSVTLGTTQTTTGKNWGIGSNAEPSYLPVAFARGGSVTYNTNGTVTPASLSMIMEHYGSSISFVFPTTSVFWLAIKIDDQYYNSLTSPLQLGASSYVLNINFASAAYRRIEIVMAQGNPPTNIYTGANDLLKPGIVRGRKGIVLGDSMGIGNSFIPTAATLTAAPSAATTGTLTANWTGATGNGYFITLLNGSTLVNIANCTLTNGSTAVTFGSSATATSTAITVNSPAVVPNGYAYLLADYLGCDDITASCIGGTGYAATAGGQTNNFLNRYLVDVVAQNPDFVLVSGGGLINDGASAAALTNAQALFAGLRASLPNAQIYASQLFNNGVGSISNAGWTFYTALKAAAAANGVIFLDLLALPTVAPLNKGTPNATPNAPLAATLANAVSAGATIFLSSTGNYDPNNHYIVDSGTSLEVVDAYTNDGARNLYPAQPFQYAHAAGASLLQTRPSLWTGAATSAVYGSSANMVGPDGTHPTMAVGHEAIARELATQMLQTLRL